MLQLHGVQSGYGASQVLFGLDLKIGVGTVATLLGRNGMGKTTTIRTLLGLVPLRAGEIRFAGERIDGRATDAIGRLGLALVPEGRQVFPNLTVRENLVAFAANRAGHADPWTLDKVFAFFPRLAERSDNRGNQLSGG
ncbi:MAG: ATP-binding cassette domain-containing protein, partial [Burkholderiales bacterium]|nr:ATP-binding cassette domain-containing protein [Burkholderiales bacterium]